MFAAGWFPRQKKSEKPGVQVVGATLAGDGVRCYLLHATPNRSRTRTITLHLYDHVGRLTEKVRVKWPRWSDGEWKGVTLEYDDNA